MVERMSSSWKIGAPLALKDALRTIRFASRRGRRFSRDVAPSVVPQPIDGFIASAMTFVDVVATRVEREATRLIRSGIGSTLELPDLRIDTSPPERAVKADQFAEAAYRGLTTALELLHADGALVSESAARAAYEAVTEQPVEGSERWAALLLCEMLHRRVIWGVSLTPAARGQERMLARLALFSLMIWLLSSRGAGEAQVALEASIALALGLRDELAAIGDDPERIEGLLMEFRHHV
jgi:hypothetical protein